MVVSALASNTTHSQDDQDLSDDQIQQLLLEAESRLRGSDTQLTQNLDANSLKYACAPFHC